MTVVIYHNPRCSKSRETMQLLESRDIDFHTRLYLQDTPSQAEIQQLLVLLGFSSARDLMRTKDALYKSLGVAEVTNEAQLIELMAENPKLIERPIVIVNDEKAKVGRPPESVLSLFD